MVGFKHFQTTCSTIQGIEAISLFRKNQVNTPSAADERKLTNVPSYVA